MTPTDVYQKLHGRITACASAKSKGRPYLQDELLSVADLAFWEAWLARHKCRIRLEDYLMLMIQNRMQDHVKSHNRRRLRERLMPDDMMDRLFGTWDVPGWLSDDAKGAAWEFIRRGFREGKSKLYKEIGWRRCWEAVHELREAYA